jgi:hypothetical protein
MIAPFWVSPRPACANHTLTLDNPVSPNYYIAPHATL